MVEPAIQLFVILENTVLLKKIKRAAMSETNKAFERYMGKDTDDDLRSVGGGN